MRSEVSVDCVFWEKEFLANIFGLFAHYSHVGYHLKKQKNKTTTGFEFKIDCHCVLINPKVII